jgi:hypothetical protein
MLIKLISEIKIKFYITSCEIMLIFEMKIITKIDSFFFLKNYINSKKKALFN